MSRAPGQELLVMTANVGAGLAFDDQVEAAVRAEDPDIVAFQELPRAQAQRLRERLADRYPHASFNGDWNEGRGILSAYPIVWAHPVEISQGRPDIVALIDVNGQELFFIVGHPRPQRMTATGLVFSFGSKRQILRLGEMTTGRAMAVLVGDFNMTPRHPGYARLEKLGLVDAFAEKGRGSGNTFPTRVGSVRVASERMARRRVPPVVRFDYIWCTPNLEVEAAWVGTDTGSDHAPVLARLRIPANASP
ncbi:MAG TPA: endonuclease/exonuclease/phosphatase family protein [Thermomicrobiales bacterium]|jgi:endonuclease/exonuclease/phosphatase family metal-dependent hydrolase|nr:endonuclease/exonuclease/phosphatase family protein [Thermomicrobiales bacterium]